jgi:tartrate dehydratase beta subunit/fumarate hydratase class I family protein
MPTIAIGDHPGFDPETATVLAKTVDDVCDRLYIDGDAHQLREAVAARIVNIARSGERDPVRIRNKIMQEVDSDVA